MEVQTSSFNKSSIIETAKKILAEEGIEHLNKKELSEKLRMDEEMFSSIFRDKHELFESLLDDYHLQLMEIVSSTQNKFHNPLMQLRHIMLEHLILNEKNKGLLVILGFESIHEHDESLRSKVLEIISWYHEEITDIIGLGKRKGLVRDDVNSGMMSEVFYELIEAANMQYVLTNYKVQPHKFFSTSWKIFLKGIYSKRSKIDVTFRQSRNVIRTTPRKLIELLDDGEYLFKKNVDILSQGLRHLSEE